MKTRTPSKRITCYNCKIAKGIPKKVMELKTIRGSKGYKERLVGIWRVEGFKMISPELWLCDKCNKKRCKVCGIILSNRQTCRCKSKHGAFYSEHPKYCKVCWDEIASEES